MTLTASASSFSPQAIDPTKRFAVRSVGEFSAYTQIEMFESCGLCEDFPQTAMWCLIRQGARESGLAVLPSCTQSGCASAALGRLWVQGPQLPLKTHWLSAFPGWLARSERYALKQQSPPAVNDWFQRMPMLWLSYIFPCRGAAWPDCHLPVCSFRQKQRICLILLLYLVAVVGDCFGPEDGFPFH